MKTTRLTRFCLYTCLWAIACGLAGCSYLPTRQAIEITGTDTRLERGQVLYVTRPPVPEEYQSAVAVFSAPIEKAVAKAFEAYTAKVIIASVIETRTPALASARKEGARYLVIPSLYRTVTEPAWLLPNDGITIELFFSVFDVPSGRHLLMRFMKVYNGRNAPGKDQGTLAWGLAGEVPSLFSKESAPQKSTTHTQSGP